MLVHVQDGLKGGQEISCTKLVIRDSSGHIVAAAISPTPEHIWLTHCGEPGFEETLRQMGLKPNFNVVVDDMRAGPGLIEFRRNVKDDCRPTAGK